MKQPIPFYQFLGYFGVLPFLGCTVMSFWDLSEQHAHFLGIVNLCYAGMIASFLAGLHWLPSVKNSQALRTGLAMLPTIIALGCIVLAMFIGFIIPLVIMAVVFWALYISERLYSDASLNDQSYKNFRLILTILVSSLLLISALGYGL